MNNNSNAEKLQNVISDNLFPEMQHISDVKQVLEVMRPNAQELQEPQVRALIYLQKLGENTYLHGEKNPYKAVAEFIMESKINVANPEYYLRTIEGLIPKPPKPIVMAEKGRR